MEIMMLIQLLWILYSQTIELIARTPGSLLTHVRDMKIMDAQS